MAEAGKATSYSTLFFLVLLCISVPIYFVVLCIISNLYDLVNTYTTTITTIDIRNRQLALN